MHGPFASCLRRLLDEGAHAGAVLMDLGMSSMQVDAPARGFSYMHDAPLDMRMDPSDEVTAATLVNEWDERDLAQIFQRYGEERFSRQIARGDRPGARARAVRDARSQLVATIKRAIPTPSRFGHGHPPSACSRRCGSPSTTSSASSRTASRARSSCAARAAAWP